MRKINQALYMALLLVTGECLAQGCGVSVVSLHFGDYDALAGVTLDTEADVYVSCDPSIAYNIKLDAGANSGGDFGSRRMVREGDLTFLEYNIFRDAVRTEIWGDGSNGTFTQLGIGTGAESHFTAYGRLPGDQNVPAGVYSDAVFVLVEW